jgi:hypothetical protein
MDPVILNRYLADQLPEAERIDFEKRLTESPAMIEELEAVARLKVGLFSLHNSGDLERVLSARIPRSRTPILALAASVAAVAIGITVWRGGSPAASPVLGSSLASLVDAAGLQPSIVARHAVLRTRVDGYDAIFERPQASGGALEIRVLPDVSAAPSSEPLRFHVELARVRDDATLESVAAVSGLEADPDGFVTVFASASRLTPGRYRLTVSPDAGTNESREEESFLIRVR